MTRNAAAAPITPELSRQPVQPQPHVNAPDRRLASRSVSLAKGYEKDPPPLPASPSHSLNEGSGSEEEWDVSLMINNKDNISVDEGKRGPLFTAAEGERRELSFFRETTSASHKQYGRHDSAV